MFRRAVAFLAVPRWLYGLALLAFAAGCSLPFVTCNKQKFWLYEEALSPRERLLLFNPDQDGWLRLSCDFPGYYHTDKTRVNRPVYPLAVSLLGRTANGFYHFSQRGFGAFAEPCTMRQAYFAALLLNLLVLIFSVVGFYRLLETWGFSTLVAALSAAQLALLPSAVWTVSEATTNFIAVGIAVAVLWLGTACYRAAEKNWQTPVRCGLLLGLMMLAKPVYDIAAAVWIVLRVRRRWLALALLAGLHLLPLLAWMLILRGLDLRYENYEVKAFGHGVWVFREFLHWPISRQLEFLGGFLCDYAFALTGAFGYVNILLAAAGACLLKRGGRGKWLGWWGLVMLMNLLLLFAIRKPAPYLAAQTFVAILPLAAVAIDRLGEITGEKYYVLVTVILIAAGTCAAHWAYFPAHLAWEIFR
jgi:hypothetical protein